MALRNKLYYPKSHIVTNLRTNGMEWMTEDGTEYTGLYHKYSDGIVLTGAVYDAQTSKKLIPYVQQVADDNFRIYDKLKKRVDYRTPRYVTVLPTMKQYQEGKFTRYILRKRNYANARDFIEVNESQFKLWKNPKTGIDGSLYDALQMEWKITGPLHDVMDENGKRKEPGVYDTNQRMVLLKEKSFPDLSNFLTDYIEFSVHSKATSSEIKNLFGTYS